jgi:hypothetical protein
VSAALRERAGGGPPSKDPSGESAESAERASRTKRALAAAAARVRAELLAPTAREGLGVFVYGSSAAFVAAAHLARLGTRPARLGALAAVLFAALSTLVWWAIARRKGRDDLRALAEAAPVLGRAEVDRMVRGIALAERIARDPASEGVSPTLARLHALRAVERLELDRLAPVGQRRARTARYFGLAALVGAACVFGAAPVRLAEGIDVAFARGGQGPFPIVWLDDPRVVVHPPAYLHLLDGTMDGYGRLVANRGAQLVLRGIPKRDGRTLLLADDFHEVPFLDDGAGGVVAHWSVATSGHLRVRARFGEVVIEEPEGWDLKAIVDEVPTVELEGAPKTIDLATAGGAVPLKYDAFDDHGLREVHLVVRVGAHEERRVLAKLDGEPKHDRGGYVLRTGPQGDPLVAKARTPIRVRIEARDNDPITGPKWGRSAELTLLPPMLGAAEARRYEALRDERDSLVDLLAVAIEEPADAATAVRLQTRFDEVSISLGDVLGQSWEGVRTPPRIVAIVKGRLRKLREAVAAELKTPGKATRAATQEAIEALTMRLDEALHALGSRDAKGIAKLLVDVAEDGAAAAHEAAQGNQPEEASTRLDVDAKALDGGGASMRRLGALGRDLGEIVQNDLRRVARARAASPPAYAQAELALRDLAARMREPVPSFGGGGNSAGSPGAPSEEDQIGDESEGEKQAGDQESALEELAKEHGSAVGEVEDALRDAEDPKSLEGLDEEVKKRAKALRDAVAGLPKNGGMQKNLENAEASLREKAESMAESLERMQVGDAHERGESALKAGEEAKDKAWMSPGADEKIDDAVAEVKKQQEWLDGLLKKIREQAGKKAKEKVKGVAPRERGLEQKAGDLGEQSEKKAPMPEGPRSLLDEAKKKMGEAADALEKGDADKALEKQREAQRLLERARDQMKGDDDPQRSGDGGNRPNTEDKLDIPKAEDHKGPEAFRKRVLGGLGAGASSPKMQEAVKRYAEGLVR